MSQWIVTVSDEQDARMQEMAETENDIWINEWVGDAVVIIDLSKVDS